MNEFLRRRTSAQSEGRLVQTFRLPSVESMLCLLGATGDKTTCDLQESCPLPGTADVGVPFKFSNR